MLSHPTGSLSRGSPSSNTPASFKGARRPIQSSPQNRFPAQPFRSPNTCSSGELRFLGSGLPTPSCAAPQRPAVDCFLRAHPNPELSVFCPVSCLPQRGPGPFPLPQAALQTPAVTNHLGWLVTAASRTPQQPHCTSTRAKMLPGPAGLLPHQVSDSLLWPEPELPKRLPWLLETAGCVPAPCPIPEGSSIPEWREGRAGSGAFRAVGGSPEVGELEA